MIELKNEKVAIPVVLIAGLIWSFGPLVVRYMNDPNLVPWQYIFARGLTIFLILNLYLFFEEGKNFYKNYFKIGWSGIIGGTGLGIAMITFIYSITNTSARCYLALFSCYAFFYSITRFYVFKRKNICQCLDSYCHCNYWINNYWPRQYSEKLFVRTYIRNGFFNWFFCLFSYIKDGKKKHQNLRL